MIRQSTRHGERIQKHAQRYSMHKVQRDYKNDEQRRNGELLSVMEVGRRRQSAVAEMYRRGMVH
jgi:hypothetical protein